MSTSYSDLESYGRCPRLFYYRNVLRIQRQKRDRALNLGSLFHDVMKDVVLGAPATEEEVFDLIHAWEVKQQEGQDTSMLFQDEIDELFAQVQQAAEMAENYYFYYGVAEFRVLHVEEEFSFVLNGTTVTLTPDLVVEDVNGDIWVMDYKTTQSIDFTPNPSGYDLQSLLYLMAVKARYPNTKGFIFDQVRKKLPTQPRLNKTKDKETGTYAVNNLNSVDTTYEILLNFLQDEAPHLLDDPRHRQRLAELRDRNNFFYRKPPILLNEEMEQALLKDLEDRIELMLTSVDYNRFPRTFLSSGYTACDRCEMRSICHAELVGWDSEYVLETEYEPRQRKNQYESEDDSD